MQRHRGLQAGDGGGRGAAEGRGTRKLEEKRLEERGRELLLKGGAHCVAGLSLGLCRGWVHGAKSKDSEPEGGRHLSHSSGVW